MLRFIRRHSRFRWFMTGGSLFAFGGALTSILLPLDVIRLHLGIWILSMTFVAKELPGTIFAPWLGRYVDHVGPRTATISGLSFAAVGSALLPLAGSDWPFVAIPVCSLLIGIGWTVLFPTVAMYLPTLVPDEHLDVANSLFRTISLIGSMAGTALASLFAAGGLYTIHIGFWLDAAAAMAAIGTTVAIGPVEVMRDAPDGASVGDSFVITPKGAGALQVWWCLMRTQPIVRPLVLMDCAYYLLVGSTVVLLPLVIITLLHRPWLYSVAMVLAAIAELIGGLIAPWLMRHSARDSRKDFVLRLYFVCSGAAGLLALLYGCLPSVWTTLTLPPAIGLLSGILIVMYSTTIQRTIPVSAMGRFQTVMAGVSSGFQGAGNFTAGAMAHRSARLGYGLVGAVVSATALGMGFFSGRGRYKIGDAILVERVSASEVPYDSD